MPEGPPMCYFRKIKQSDEQLRVYSMILNDGNIVHVSINIHVSNESDMTDSGLHTQTFGEDRRKIEWELCFTMIYENLNNGCEKHKKKTQNDFVLRN